MPISTVTGQTTTPFTSLTPIKHVKDRFKFLTGNPKFNTRGFFNKRQTNYWEYAFDVSTRSHAYRQTLGIKPSSFPNDIVVETLPDMVVADITVPMPAGTQITIDQQKPVSVVSANLIAKIVNVETWQIAEVDGGPKDVAQTPDIAVFANYITANGDTVVDGYLSMGTMDDLVKHMIYGNGTTQDDLWVLTTADQYLDSMPADQIAARVDSKKSGFLSTDPHSAREFMVSKYKLPDDEQVYREYALMAFSKSNYLRRDLTPYLSTSGASITSKLPDDALLAAHAEGIIDLLDAINSQSIYDALLELDTDDVNKRWLDFLATKPSFAKISDNVKAFTKIHPNLLELNPIVLNQLMNTMLNTHPKGRSHAVREIGLLDETLALFADLNELALLKTTI